MRDSSFLNRIVGTNLLATRLDHQDRMLDDIKTLTARTNGRVDEHEVQLEIIAAARLVAAARVQRIHGLLLAALGGFLGISLGGLVHTLLTGSLI